MSPLDFFLLALFVVIVIIYEMLSRGIITMETLKTVFSGNIPVYIILAGVFVYLRINQSGRNNDLERRVLSLNNDL